MKNRLKDKLTTAEEAVKIVKNGDTIGLSGFTQAGCPQLLSGALARRATEEHNKGRNFTVSLLTGASTNEHIDGALARAEAISRRAPYQSTKQLRNAINEGKVCYSDVHLSHFAQEISSGIWGDVDVAFIEAADVTEDGEILLTAAVGISPTLGRVAKKIIIELNAAHPKKIQGLHDIYEVAQPPHRREIPIYKTSDRIGTPRLKVDPDKIVAIVESNLPYIDNPFTPLDEVTEKIGKNVSDFLLAELQSGRLPEGLPPIQSGVGNVANAVLGTLGNNPLTPTFEVYTEVIQNAVIDLMKKGKVSFASGCSLSVSHAVLQDIYNHWEDFKDKLLLRPEEISNNPEVVRRLGLITINTAIEFDLFGNVNSTHLFGNKMMNGIGGSGDFTRNGYLSIYTAPSVAKGGVVSAVVPMVSHTDHSEHSVKVVITEQGIADLRGLSPRERAEAIIEQCAHPDYRPLLRKYLSLQHVGQTPHNLYKCFAMHIAAMEEGDMRKAKF